MPRYIIKFILYTYISPLDSTNIRTLVAGVSGFVFIVLEHLTFKVVVTPFLQIFNCVGSIRCATQNLI